MDQPLAGGLILFVDRSKMIVDRCVGVHRLGYTALGYTAIEYTALGS